MRQFKLLITISVLLMAVLACSALPTLQQVQTEVPALITNVPTDIAPLNTAIADFTPPALPNLNGSGTASAGGLGISVTNIRKAMEATNQFVYTDGTLDGKPALIATLSSSAATTMPGFSEVFSIAFVGDPENLEEIKMTVPFSSDSAAVSAGLGLVTVMFTAILPANVVISFIPWVNDNYSKLPDNGSVNMSSGNMNFVLSRAGDVVTLDITPAQ